MKALIGLTVTALALGAMGCSSTGQPGSSYSSISGNPTPEWSSMGERPIDRDSHYAIMANTNRLNFGSDLARVWYLDHPSRLSPFPILSASGQPR